MKKKTHISKAVLKNTGYTQKNTPSINELKQTIKPNKIKVICNYDYYIPTNNCFCIHCEKLRMEIKLKKQNIY
jgi:hypothetical protein